MQIVKIWDKLSVAGQPQVADFSDFLAKGFATVLNVRPDGEELGQPGTGAERQAAENAGVAYGFIPVSGATITKADIRAFQSAVADAQGPVLAHCKSGTRALALHDGRRCAAVRQGARLRPFDGRELARARPQAS